MKKKQPVRSFFAHAVFVVVIVRNYYERKYKIAKASMPYASRVCTSQKR